MHIATKLKNPLCGCGKVAASRQNMLFSVHSLRAKASTVSTEPPWWLINEAIASNRNCEHPLGHKFLCAFEILKTVINCACIIYALLVQRSVCPYVVHCYSAKPVGYFKCHPFRSSLLNILSKHSEGSRNLTFVKRWQKVKRGVRNAFKLTYLSKTFIMKQWVFPLN